MPVYSAKNVYRGIVIDVNSLQSFLSKYKEGEILPWNDFTSCAGSESGSFVNKPNVNIVFEIEQLTARDISDFADGINYKTPPYPKPEILIPPGKFKSLGNPVFDPVIGKWRIKVKQIQ